MISRILDLYLPWPLEVFNWALGVFSEPLVPLRSNLRKHSKNMHFYFQFSETTCALEVHLGYFSKAAVCFETLFLVLDFLC